MATAAAERENHKAPSPHGGLARSIGKNTLFGLLANLTQVGTRLITVPIVIHYLGLGGYGIWNIVMTTATYMRFGSVGVKTAFQKYVAEATGDGDYDRANRLLSTGCAVMLVLSVLGLIPVALFAPQIATLAGVPPEFLKSSAGAISLLALIMGMANVGAAFEATVMGGHRIDIVRKCSTLLTVGEGIATVVVLRLGYGLFAMAGVMGASELIYISCCYFASHQVVPQIQVGIKFVSRDVLGELFRFAGSYQLVNLLEVLYASLVPFAVLRAFGANAAGVYAVVTRMAASASMLNEAFLPPILSGGTMVYASGSAERMQALLAKAFKVTLALSLFPLGFIAVFGSMMAHAWTGTTDPSYRVAFYLICTRQILAALSLLALVLYRISGKALLDNIRQALRIAVMVAVVILARKLGFYGVLGGMAFAELVVLLFMVFALSHTFHLFRAKSLLPDTIRMLAAAVLVLGTGAIASWLPVPVSTDGRLFDTLKLLEVSLACLLVAWPTLLRTGSITRAEGKALFGALLPQRSG